jgi:hypothetical protein
MAGMYLPQLCKTHKVSSRRLIVDPIKKAMDEQALRRLYMPRYCANPTLAKTQLQHNLLFLSV